MSEYTPPTPYTPTPMNPADEKLWSTLTHIGGIFFSFVPALVIYLVLKDRGPFVRQHTATALNFQLTLLIANLIAGMLWLVIIGFFLTIALGILVIVLSIIAAIAANKGEWYTYPLSIKFVS